MSTQLSLLDRMALRLDNLEPEVRAKARGQKLAAAAHHTDLRLAREVARELAEGGRVISADLVKAETLRRFPDMDWGNFAGSLFAGQDWRSVGFIQSKASGAHCRVIRQWTLREKK